MSKDESVLCIRASDVADLGLDGPFTPRVAGLFHVLSRTTPTFIPRAECEGNPSYKQIVPYVVFVHQSADAVPLIFTYRREPSGGEDRLHGRRSLGVGGHVNLDDLRAVPLADVRKDDPQGPAVRTIHEAMTREIHEEIGFRKSLPHEINTVGILWDDSDPVGRDHVGLVYVADCRYMDMHHRETGDSCWRPLAEIMDRVADFESWSRIVAERYLADRYGFSGDALTSPSATR